MKVLVTGATGVYGRGVVGRLRRAGHDVVAMARNTPDHLPAGVTFVKGDVAEYDDVERAVEGCEVVVHLAFVVSPLKSEEETRRINLGGTQNVLDSMKKAGARRLVFVSSAMSYGANPDNPDLFHETDEQRPAPDYLYGTCKKEAEALIRASGIDAVMARTAVTVGRNTDNLILDIFAAPAVLGIKGVDIRYQLVHEEDIGRFVAHACEHGPPGPVNVAPSDFLPLHELAAILGKRYVEVTEAQAIKGVEFAWKHDLMKITPSEISGISYLPRMATDRLANEWNFQCAWSTAEAVYDLRRAVAGVSVLGTHRIPLPWRIRYPQLHPGEVTLARAGARVEGIGAGELDSDVTVDHPSYVAAVRSAEPMDALTLSTYAQVLRTAVKGALDAVGTSADETRELTASGSAIVGHRLYLNEDVLARLRTLPWHRRRLLQASYDREVARLAGWAEETVGRIGDPGKRPDPALEALLGSVRDELAWLWSAYLVGEVLAGRREIDFGHLMAALPSGDPLAGSPNAGGAGPPAAALARALAELVRERIGRVVASGALGALEDGAHLTWDELMEPPADAQAIVERRRAEHEQLRAEVAPKHVSGVAPESAMARAT